MHISLAVSGHKICSITFNTFMIIIIITIFFQIENTKVIFFFHFNAIRKLGKVTGTVKNAHICILWCLMNIFVFPT